MATNDIVLSSWVTPILIDHHMDGSKKFIIIQYMVTRCRFDHLILWHLSSPFGTCQVTKFYHKKTLHITSSIGERVMCT